MIGFQTHNDEKKGIDSIEQGKLWPEISKFIKCGDFQTYQDVWSNEDQISGDGKTDEGPWTL